MKVLALLQQLPYALIFCCCDFFQLTHLQFLHLWPSIIICPSTLHYYLDLFGRNKIEMGPFKSSKFFIIFRMLYFSFLFFAYCFYLRNCGWFLVIILIFMIFLKLKMQPLRLLLFSIIHIWILQSEFIQIYKIIQDFYLQIIYFTYVLFPLQYIEC